jgi:hypothetical protein
MRQFSGFGTAEDTNKRYKYLFEQGKKNAPCIIFIDELHMLVGAGSAGSSVDAANILKPALSRGELQCIGATTLDEYRKYIESDAALERRFQPVMVEDVSSVAHHFKGADRAAEFQTRSIFSRPGDLAGGRSLECWRRSTKQAAPIIPKRMQQF